MAIDPPSRNSSQEPPVSPREFVAYTRGEATPAVVARVKAALVDERSELRRWLGGVERSLEATCNVPMAFARLRWQAIVDFVVEQGRSGRFTSDEVDQILLTGSRGVDASLPSGSIIPSIVRMFDRITELHPDIVE